MSVFNKPCPHYNVEEMQLRGLKQISKSPEELLQKVKAAAEKDEFENAAREALLEVAQSQNPADLGAPGVDFTQKAPEVKRSKEYKARRSAKTKARAAREKEKGKAKGKAKSEQLLEANKEELETFRQIKEGELVIPEVPGPPPTDSEQRPVKMNQVSLSACADIIDLTQDPIEQYRGVWEKIDRPNDLLPQQRLAIFESVKNGASLTAASAAANVPQDKAVAWFRAAELDPGADDELTSWMLMVQAAIGQCVCDNIKVIRGAAMGPKQAYGASQWLVGKLDHAYSDKAAPGGYGPNNEVNPNMNVGVLSPEALKKVAAGDFSDVTSGNKQYGLEGRYKK